MTTVMYVVCRWPKRHYAARTCTVKNTDNTVGRWGGGDEEDEEEEVRRKGWKMRNEGEKMGEGGGRTLFVSCSTGSVVKSVWLVTLLTVVSIINHNTCTQIFRTHWDIANIKWGLILSNWNTIPTINAVMQLRWEVHMGIWWETSHKVDNKAKCKHNGMGK
jgi:hypothetical protein